MLDKLKNLAWLVGAIVVGSSFIHTLVNLDPRILKLEERMGSYEARATGVETRVSGIEIKLDAIYAGQQEQGKDIKDIYHLIMDRHK